MRDHHFPCPCGAELADECPKCARANPFGSMRITRPGDWFSQQYECVMPADADERAAYEAQLADEAENGPAA